MKTGVSGVYHRESINEFFVSWGANDVLEKRKE